MALSKLAAFRARYKTVGTEEGQKKSALKPLPNRSLVSHDLCSLGSTKSRRAVKFLGVVKVSVTSVSIRPRARRRDRP